MIEGLDIKLLRTFIVVAQAKNFRRASEQLNTSPSIVSDRIKRLEDVLGGKVVERTRQGVVLTKAGGAFLEDAKLIIKRTEKAAQTFRAISTGYNTTLRLGSTHWAMFDIAPRILSILRRDAPDMNVELIHLSTADQIQLLPDGMIDIGLMRSDAHAEGLIKHPIGSDTLLIAMPSDDELAGKAMLEWRDLADRQLILTSRLARPPVYDTLLSHCLNAGFSPQIYQEDVQFWALLAHVAAGNGLAFVPRGHSFNLPDIVVRELTPGLTIRYVLATRQKNENMALERLISIVQEKI